MQSIDSRAVDHVLTSTRAVRRRLDLERQVSLSVIRECLDIAFQAPTGGAKEHWRWLVISDPQRRSAIAQVYRGACEAPFRKAYEQAETDAARKAYEGAIYLAEILHLVPIHVIPCALDRLDDKSSNLHASSYYGSIYPAIWNFHLALRARGLGTTLTTVHLRREDQMAELLGIPSDVSQIALMPVGYTIGLDFKRARRRPVEDVTYSNQWGTPFR